MFAPVHVDPLGREPNTHIAVPSFGHNLNLEIVEAAGGRYGVGGPDAAGVLVCLAVPLVVHPEVALGQPDVIEAVLSSNQMNSFFVNIPYTFPHFYACIFQPQSHFVLPFSSMEEEM